ncbi:MAG: hypothetical protein ACP5KA_05455 [Desulfurococcaceae archaeon]
MGSDSFYTISSYVEVLYIASTLLICWVPKHVLSENLINNGVSCPDVANKVKSVQLESSSRSMALSSDIEFGKSAEEGLQVKRNGRRAEARARFYSENSGLSAWATYY